MVARCTNPKWHRYDRYGGRGISVCAKWRIFEAFLADMGIKPRGFTLERMDNDGNYEPGNCLWATRKTQARNRRGNRLLTLNGVSRSLAEWSDVTGVNYNTLKSRLKYGWSIERVLTVPVRGI